MSYKGVKFDIEFLGRSGPLELRIQEFINRCNILIKKIGLKKWCYEFHEKELAPKYEGGSYGNLSFRIEKEKNEFMITSANTDLGKMKSDCFVRVIMCDLEQKIVKAYGKKKPSSESNVHYIIYKERPEINAIFHGHCDKIIENTKRLKLPETRIEVPYGTPELVELVKEIVHEGNFLNMKNHGFLSLGKNLKEAGKQTLEIYRKCE